MSSAMPMVVDGTSHVTGANSGKRKLKRRVHKRKRVRNSFCSGYHAVFEVDGRKSATSLAVTGVVT